MHIVRHEDLIMTWSTKAGNQGYSARPQDYDRAMEWRLKAAHHNIGVLFTYRHGVPGDYKKAIGWYVKGAKQGYGLAQDAISVQRFKKAANTGNVMAQYSAGILYHRGQGVPVDNTLSTQWLF
ncbi:hypothetical protein KI688_001170 [Linnemannia hyalina]|uniref:Sel1 repeat family protein n=1 Tax=Linnemannia hyalina TaxID=64524 RepID=A0A9P8BYN5_9FUNG|nr:hypothetical protein KI688_001170 [Linnemannia hyalina]